MPDRAGATRVSVIEAIIPRPPVDVAPMRTAFSRMVSDQWQAHVPSVLRGWESGISGSQFTKGRFIGEMYARACYSVLLVSHAAPKSLRLPVRASTLLPQSRGLTIRLASVLLVGIEQLLPRAVHRQLLLTSALMGMMDVVLDDAASAGEAAALRIASLTAQPYPTGLLPPEQVIVTLVHAARQSESAWQAEYWNDVLQPAIHDYCLAEVLATERAPDPIGMGHRWAGIEAAIKGMWYVVSPLINLQGEPSGFERSQWNREQRWMADTTLLMQMIDDWVDQDEDRSARLTPVVSGDWTLDSITTLFDKTIEDLTMLLDESGIQKPILKAILVDLYKDFLHTAMDAMRSGVAA